MNMRLKASWLFLVSLGFAAAPIAASGLPVPNASFEEGGPAPLGWTFTGPGVAQSRAWTSSEAFAGKRALRLEGQHGSQHWDSAAISVRAEQKHLLRWQARFQGEKAWRFL